MSLNVNYGLANELCEKLSIFVVGLMRNKQPEDMQNTVNRSLPDYTKAFIDRHFQKISFVMPRYL